MTGGGSFCSPGTTGGASFDELDLLGLRVEVLRCSDDSVSLSSEDLWRRVEVSLVDRVLLDEVERLRRRLRLVSLGCSSGPLDTPDLRREVAEGVAEEAAPILREDTDTLGLGNDPSAFSDSPKLMGTPLSRIFEATWPPKFGPIT